MTQDSQFAGSIPAIYDECLVPVIFAPYARDLADRAVALRPSAVLELAAGTGVVSHLLAAALPEARIVATDLNAAMLAVAEARGHAPNLSFEPADAQSLAFHDGLFDLVVAQFGAMFFPDKAGAYREARRVLAPGGTLLFNVWDRLDANTGTAAIDQAVRAALPGVELGFIARTPFGYHDPAVIEAELHEAGFTEVAIERVERTSPPGSAERLARGMCEGSPLAHELAGQGAEARERAFAAAREAAVAAEESGGGLAMAALVVTARG
jgi:ubiquinone/menaquinone biosynthesis C-methylase UbiE